MSVADVFSISIVGVIVAEALGRDNGLEKVTDLITVTVMMLEYWMNNGDHGRGVLFI